MATRTSRSWSTGVLRLTSRHRWLTLIVVGGAVGAILVAAGVMTFNAALSFGAVAAMLLMHLGGHGMHGHGQHQAEGSERSEGHLDHRGVAGGGDLDGAFVAGRMPPDDRVDEGPRAGGCH